MARLPPKDLQKLLTYLHDAPVDNQGASDEVLAKVYSYLMSIPRSPTDHGLHWFCDKANATTVAAASFLLRLFAYDSPEVEQWKAGFSQCLQGCCGCIRSLERIKVISRHTYFGAFSDDTMQSFYRTFEGWELITVRQYISKLTASKPEISHEIQLATFYRILFNWAVFSDSSIQTALRSGIGDVKGLPKDIAAPGTLLLLFHDDSRIRQWAHNQASKATVVPIPGDQFVGMYNKALDLVIDLMSSPSSAAPIGSSLPLSANNSDSWQAFRTFLRHVPPELLTSKRHKIDARRVVVGQLHYNGPQFSDVLSSLLLLLKRLDAQLWGDEGIEYPQIVFDAVKDNPSFVALLEGINTDGKRHRHLTWFTEYLHTLRDHAAFGEVLSKMVDFLSEEMQHERFHVSKSVTMEEAMVLLVGVLLRQQDGHSSAVNAAFQVIDIHSETIISVALDRLYSEPQWKSARKAARSLISKVLVFDIKATLSAITGICATLADVMNGLPVRTAVPEFSIRTQIWKRIYSAVQTNDMEGLAAIISIIARAAHIDRLSEKPFHPTFDKTAEAQGTMSPKVAFKAINNAVEVFSDGFLNAMTRFGDYNVSTSALDVLAQRGVAKDVVLLLLSPVERIQAAAKSLISLAFDVDGRQECFRALFENLPDAALEGVTEFLTIFVQFAPVAPEACSLSSSLVRCFTDIIEVLCASPAGLLRDAKYLRSEDDNGPAAQLPQLWMLMTRSLAVIFKYCPSWSVYFENEEMILWMRDALIFGRDLLAQWRVIEKAASSVQALGVSAKSIKLSPVGKKMVTALQELLPELARWLRLTDEELLHQSFSLIQFLLDIHRDTGIRPSVQGLAKLTKHIENAKKNKPSQTATRLDASRLSALSDAIAYFDEEIEVVSVSLGPKKDVKGPRDESRAERVSLSKSSDTRPQQNRVYDQTTSKTSVSRYFTEEDQRRLDASTVMPSFRKAIAVPDALRTKRYEGKVVSQPSSSSESSDDESEGEEHKGGLAALAKFQKSPRVRRQAEKRQVKTIEIEGVRNVVGDLRDRRDRQAEARRVALRMKPKLAGLHKYLLSWNYDHNGPMPPGDVSKPVSVPDAFKNYDEYRQVFEPLLLIECWGQICQSKDELQDIYETKIVGRGYVDDWLDLDVTIHGPVRQDWYLAETDIVLLRNASIQRCLMAKTQSYRATLGGIQTVLRCYIKADGDRGLQIGTNWQLSKIFSLSTIHREYAALISLPYYDFVEMILRPKLPMPTQINSRDVYNAMSTYGINEPQAKAVLSSLESTGFSLIQGPPGTGKTSTICSLVAVFLSRRRRPPTTIEIGKGSTQMDKGSFPKVLICAPSNAAIDEVAYRIKEGYRGSKRMPDNVKVVRIGTDRAINPSVKDISLDALVDQKLNGNTSATKEKGLGDELVNVRQQLEELKTTRSRILGEIKNVQDNIIRYKTLDEELKKVNSRRIVLTQQLDRLKDQRKSESRTLDAIRRKARLEVLQEADVICTTLSGAGHESLDRFDFETIVIDEAAQAIELSSLIPLRYKCMRCIMVGDPQQLPPTVISQGASRYGYNQSLFVRLQKQRPEAMQLLSIQYRMHPEISCLPSRIFYQNKLHDGPEMAAKTGKPWHTHPKFGMYKFFNITGTEERSNRSLVNKVECQVAAALYIRLRREFSFANLDFRVGVVTMYRAQVAELRRSFERCLGEKLEGKVDFNTVDGFQGQEKDIIILSCVRGGVNQDNVGFLADTRRMNVALTRAKSSLFILGNAPTLERSNATWADIIADAKNRSCLIDADATYFISPTSASLVPPPPSDPRRVKGSTSIRPPPDLVTPKDYKAGVDLQSSGANHIDHRIADGSGNLKRTLENIEDAMPEPKASRAAEGPTEPRPPPLKRTKQPQSIFIPKKKRP